MSSSLMLRRVFLATALTGVVVLATGCNAGSATSSGGTAAATAAGASVTTTPAATTPTAANRAQAGSRGSNTQAQPAGTTPKRIAACPTRYLKVRPGVSQGTAGSVYQVIDFTNIAQTTCTLYGYPGVSLAGGSPVHQIGPAATRNTTGPRALVTLAPGATGNVLLRITDAGNYPAAQCHPTAAQYLQVYPPGQTTPIYVAYTSTACAGTVGLLSVSALQPGSGSAS
ncbi:DUF4232 domain-containing protein [Streptomyces collinus]|uniref:DUF4232 domain-containing protein n=1 Tax=Streptomyces collinus TaxID=42684 RepID=UPI00339E5541